MSDAHPVAVADSSTTIDDAPTTTACGMLIDSHGTPSTVTDPMNRPSPAVSMTVDEPPGRRRTVRRTDGGTST